MTEMLRTRKKEAAEEKPAQHVHLPAQRRLNEIRMRAIRLTPMQRQIFEAICEGKRTDEIAVRIKRSKNTVRNHIGAIFRSFRVASRIELIAKARRLRLLIKNQRGRPAPILRALSPMQQAVFDQICTDRPIREIAKALEISHSTLRTHMRDIFRIYRIHSRVELVVALMSADSVQ